MHIHPFDNPCHSDQMESAASAAAGAGAVVHGAVAIGGASSPTPSLVSRAKTALHSAAVLAEKVLTEIKADMKNDREGDGQTKKELRKMDDQVSSAANCFCGTREEDSEPFSTTAQNGNNFSNKLTIPSGSIIKQLAAAYESVKNFRTIKDLLALGEDPLPTKDKSSLSFSAVKSLVLREKDDKSFSDFNNDDEVLSMLQFLFDPEKMYDQMKKGSESACHPKASMPKDIRGAPPESFTVRLSEAIGSFKSLHKVASFWNSVVGELRKLWYEGLPVPWMPLDEKPNLHSCLLHQQLQVINCCIARKRRRTAAVELLDSVIRETSLENYDSVDYPSNSDCMRCARLNSGDYVPRLGVDHLSDNLTMLETGEPIYSPITQEGPILTEELIKETEELVLRTGSFGAGCSQLLSDMQAFKAANPGCVLEDFIRWHSPPDWTEMESTCEVYDSTNGEGSSRRGRLSKRMQKEGNLWQELWESAKAIPAVKQTPIFDEDLAVESILTTLEDIPPSELFEQLFFSLLCSAIAIAEVTISPENSLSKLFYECKDWVVATCQNGIASENIGDICKVYETIETVITHPEEAITIMDQQEGTQTPSEEPKNRFKRINLNFIKKDMNLLRKKTSKEEKKSEEKQNVLSQLFEKKTSLFLKKQPKVKRTSCSEPILDVNDWTIL